MRLSMKCKMLMGVLLPVLLMPGAPAQDNGSELQAAAYRNSIAQDEVSRQADEVRQSLALLLQDFYQNQLQSKDALEAQKVAELLATLNEEQMRPLVEMLRQAGAGESGGTIQGKLTEASKDQKKVQVDLKDLETRLALHINQASIQNRFRQLVLRQAGNLRQTRELADQGKSGKNAALISVCQGEQSAIREEVRLAEEALKKVVENAAAADRSLFEEALRVGQQCKLSELALGAAEQTGSGKFNEAVGSQARLFEGLQAVLLKLKQKEQLQERVQALKNQLEQMVIQERQMASAMEKADDTAKRGIREEQARLADEVVVIQAELTGLNAIAAGQLDRAGAQMDEALLQLRDPAKIKGEEQKKVAGNQYAAAELLAAAQKSLQEQEDKLLAEQNTPRDASKALQDLAKLDMEVRKTLAEQQALGRNPDDKKLQDLAQQAADLQQKALPQSPQAAQDLGEAATQMAENPEQAAQSLADASEALQQQMEDLKAAVAQQQQLENLANQLEQAQTQTQEAAENLAQTGGKNDTAEAVKDMQQAQQALQQAQAAGGAVPGAQEAMEQAQKNLNEGVLNAAQGKAGEAQAANQKAQEALQQAMESVGQALAQAQAQAAAAAPAMAQGGQPGQQMANDQGVPPQQSQSGGGMLGDVPGFMTSSGPAGSNGQVTSGLKNKDREAIAMFKKEKAPIEYQGMVQQYLQNLAEGSTPTAVAQ